LIILIVLLANAKCYLGKHMIIIIDDSGGV
jgi:hypothetical protein